MFVIKETNIKTFNEDIELAVNYLLGGRTVIYPADTCYGIGSLLTSKPSHDMITKLKHSPKSKYYSVIVPGLNWISDNLEVNTFQMSLLKRYLPGEYTFILKKKDSQETLGVRIPNNNFINQVSTRVNRPFISTSANISGQATPYSLADLRKGILNQTDITKEDILVLNAGKLEKGRISTIIDLTIQKPKIIRQGSGLFLN